MDVGKILKSGRTIVLTGLMQYPLIVLFGFLVAHALALLGLAALVGNGLGPLYVGLVIGGSSTLIVVKLFQEAFELDTVPGRVALGLLVIEDVWAIIVIVLQPNFRHPEILPIVESFIGIAILGGITFLAARTLFPVAFRWIAKVPEIILVGAIAWCFAIVFLGASFDFVLAKLFGVETHFAVSSGMGALIAGATIASLPYSIEIITKVSVVKDFFVTLFFVGLGLGIPAPSAPRFSSSRSASRLPPSPRASSSSSRCSISTASTSATPRSPRSASRRFPSSAWSSPSSAATSATCRRISRAPSSSPSCSPRSPPRRSTATPTASTPRSPPR